MRVGGGWGVRVPAHGPGEPGDRGPLHGNEPYRGPGAGRVRHARISPDGYGGLPHRQGQRVRQRQDRRTARNVRHTTLPVPQEEPYDNAVVETTNRLLKKELIYRNRCTSLKQLRDNLNGYVWWFNNQRLHSTLGYRSPNEYTQQRLVLQ